MPLLLLSMHICLSLWYAWLIQQNNLLPLLNIFKYCSILSTEMNDNNSNTTYFFNDNSTMSLVMVAYQKKV